MLTWLGHFSNLFGTDGNVVFNDPENWHQIKMKMSIIMTLKYKFNSLFTHWSVYCR